MILRANDIETLIITGIATSGVVLSTLPARRGRGLSADRRRRLLFR